MHVWPSFRCDLRAAASHLSPEPRYSLQLDCRGRRTSKSRAKHVSVTGSLHRFAPVVSATVIAGASVCVCSYCAAGWVCTPNMTWTPITSAHV